MQAFSSNADQVVGASIAQTNPTGISDSNQTPVISDGQSLKKMVPNISLGGSVAEGVCLAINQGSLPRDKPVLLKGLEFESMEQVNTIPDKFQMENCSVKISIPSGNFDNSSQSHDSIFTSLSNEQAEQQALMNSYNQSAQTAAKHQGELTLNGEQVEKLKKGSQTLDLTSFFQSINSTICIKNKVIPPPRSGGLDVC